MLAEGEIILSEKNICFLDSMNFEKAVKILLETMNCLEDKEKIYEKVLERENIVSTSIGKGLAIPHGRCKFLNKFYLMVGISQNGEIDWKLIDNIPIKIVCLLVGPENRQREYLFHLANITSILKEEENRSKFLCLEEKKNIVNIFKSC